MPRPRQQDLPTMEDREIKALKNAALAYADVRDERISLNAKEVELKQKLLALMKEHKRETYNCDGVLIELVHEQETVKVTIEKKKKKAPENGQ